MKKSFLLIAFAIATLSMTSCKSETKTETTAVENEVAYVCPMGCEEEKTYAEKGKCPVCEMELVAVNETEAHDHEGHNHDSHKGHNH